MPFGYRGSGMGTANAGHQEFVFLAKPEMKRTLELAFEKLAAKNFFYFSMQPSSNPEEEPVLHEDVLEQLRRSAEKSEQAVPQVEVDE